ncbi:hypothetical protein BDV97DRAFT_361567 [Delphinella strobiligena]|nr:hypothetical protein BDV97DRAFT_361567 [Delphinella strobiligena]
MATLEAGIDNLGDRPHHLSVTCAAFLALTWTAVILRVWVRAHLIRSFGWDDWTILLTLATYTSDCAIWVVVAQIETGDDMKNAAKLGPLVFLPYLARLMKLIVVFETLYLWSTVVLKISLSIFFLRVITKQWHRNVVYVTTFLNTTYGIIFAFIALFRCGSLNHSLANELAGKCISDDALQSMNYISASLNAVTDWIYVFFPIYVVWHAPMPRKAKVSAGILLGMGAMGSICSLIRIAYIPGLKAGPKFLSQAIEVGTWSIVEPGIGISAASLATLRPLIRSMRDVSRNIKSTMSSKKSDSVQRSGTRMGGKIPAAPTLSYSHPKSAPYQIQDPESGIIFDIEASGSDERALELFDFGHDVNKAMVLSDEHEAPAIGPIDPTPSLRLSQNQRNDSQRSLIPHAFPPVLDPRPQIDRAYIREGRMIIRRDDDYDPNLLIEHNFREER